MKYLLKHALTILHRVHSQRRIAYQAACICVLAATTTSAAFAQDAADKKPAEGESFSFPSDESGTLSFPETATNYVDPNKRGNRDKVDQAVGIDGSIGFIGLQAFGRDESIAPVELFPYVQTDNRILFGDFRGFIDMHGRVGMNAGTGFRFIEPNEIALFGVNAFYDADDTSGRSFHQMSVGWEARTEWAGLYGNVYMPVGTTDKRISQSIMNPHFDENNVLLDVRRQAGKAMTGLDINLQAYLPGEFLEDHQVQATAGWYHFEGGTGVKAINGYRLQLQGYVVPAIGALTSVTRDDTYGTNFNIGVFWRFGTREMPGTSLHGQLRRFVDRNYNVILTKHTTVKKDVVAHNADGSVLIVQHVGGSSATGDGTFSNPFNNLTDARNAAQSPNIIFMHQGAVVNDGIVLGDNQSLVGEGSSFMVRDDRYGAFYLPGASTAAPGPGTPQILGPIGDAVVLGNNSQVTGIKISNAGGRGIVAKNVQNVNIANVIVENATGNGVDVEGLTGSTLSNVTVNGGGADGIRIANIDDVLNLNNIYVQDVTGNGVHVDGGYGTISFTKDLSISRTGQSAFLAENMKARTTVDDKGTTSTLDDVTTITPSVISIEKLVVRNGGGGFGDGMHTQNNAGLIGALNVDIETNGASAIYSRQDNGLLVGNGTLSTTNAPVADVEGSAIKIALKKITVDGGAVGMRFKDSTGNFMVYGDGKNSSSGGSIKNTTVGISMENAGTVGLQTVDFTGNGKLAQVNNAGGLIIAGSTVTGTTNMFIDAMNLTQLQFYQSTFNDNTLSSSTGILYQVNAVGSFTASISNNLVTALPVNFVSVKGLAGSETASLTYAFQNNAIDMSNAIGTTASTVNWSGPLLSYTTDNTIVGTGSGQTGINVTTGVGTGLGQIQASNNLITMSGTNAIGIDLNTQSPANVIADNNQIKMQGANQTGIRAYFGKASGVAMASNVITDYAGGGTGILFTSIEDESQVALDNNTIDLSRFSTFVDRGIVVSAFTASDGNPPVVQFFSNTSNTILGATTPHVIPATGAKGRLLINNAAVIFP